MFVKTGDAQPINPLPISPEESEKVSEKLDELKKEIASEEKKVQNGV